METAGTQTDLTGLRVFISYPRGGLAHSWAQAIQQELEANGVAVAWRDEDAIAEGDQNWLKRIAEGLERCDVLAYVLTDERETSSWVTRELLTAQQKNKPIVTLRVEPVSLPHIIKETQPVEHWDDQADTLQRLADALFREWRKSLKYSTPQPQPQDVPSLLDSLQRQRELKWLDEIIYVDYSDRADLYTELEAEEQRSLSLERAMKSVRIETHAVLEAFGQQAITPDSQKQKTYADVLQAYRELQTRPVRRLAVLGDPGAGKTFSLERIALEYAKSAKDNPRPPFHCWCSWGVGRGMGSPWRPLSNRPWGIWAEDFAKLREQGRAILLLDAMNEIPPGQRRHKAQQIQHLAQDERFSSVLVSCRARDLSRLPAAIRYPHPAALDAQQNPRVPPAGAEPSPQPGCDRQGGCPFLADRGWQ